MVSCTTNLALIAAIIPVVIAVDASQLVDAAATKRAAEAAAVAIIIAIIAATRVPMEKVTS